MPTRGHGVKLGGAGALSSLMIGCFTLDAHQQNPFMSSLPGIIHLKSQHVQAEPGLEATMRLLVSEISGNGPGGDVLVARLSDAIFVQIVRAYIAQIKQCTETPGWLKALTDPQIGAALNLIHEKPEAPWTVATLADSVNMSRTSFATRFSALVKETPIDYLTSWRMQKAVALMRDEEASVENIGATVGYTSRAAFAKAFKKQFGRSPGEYRNILTAK
jgi:AraC-like DNA-binding protein